MNIRKLQALSVISAAVLLLAACAPVNENQNLKDPNSIDLSGYNFTVGESPEKTSVVEYVQKVIEKSELTYKIEGITIRYSDLSGNPIGYDVYLPSVEKEYAFELNENGRVIKEVPLLTDLPFDGLNLIFKQDATADELIANVIYTEDFDYSVEPNLPYSNMLILLNSGLAVQLGFSESEGEVIRKIAYMDNMSGNDFYAEITYSVSIEDETSIRGYLERKR